MQTTSAFAVDAVEMLLVYAVFGIYIACMSEEFTVTLQETTMHTIFVSFANINQQGCSNSQQDAP